jgi:acyl-CoA reductase-like NAD-dependent aldehyde dehydrogenase
MIPMDKDTEQGKTAPEKQLYIGGHWLDGQEWFEVRDKITGEVLASVPRCEDELFEMAVQSARDSLVTTTRMSPADRSRLLSEWADRFDSLRIRVFRLLHRESAVPLAWAESEAAQAVAVLRQAAAEALRSGLEHAPPGVLGESGARHDFSLAQPLGTVAALLPDQHPLYYAALVAASTLATGCPLVLMASPLAPLSVIHFLEAGAACGLPAGSVNLVYGLVRDLGKKLATDPRVTVLVTAGPQRDQQTLGAVGAGRRLLAVGAGFGCALIDPTADITLTVTGLLGRRFRHPLIGRAAPYFILCPQDLSGRLYAGLSAGLQSLGGAHLAEASASVPWQTTDSGAQRAEDWLKSIVQTGGILVSGGQRRGPFVEPAVVAAPAGHRRISPPPAQAPFFIVDSYDKQPRRQLLRFPDLEEACVFTSDMDRALDWARLPDVPHVDVLSTRPGNSAGQAEAPRNDQLLRLMSDLIRTKRVELFLTE